MSNQSYLTSQPPFVAIVKLIISTYKQSITQPITFSVGIYIRAEIPHASSALKSAILHPISLQQQDLKQLEEHKNKHYKHKEPLKVLKYPFRPYQQFQ